MVVKNRFEEKNERFRRKLKLIVARTLPIVLTSGAMLLTDCGPNPGPNSEPNPTTKQAEYNAPTIIDGRRPDGLLPPSTGDIWNGADHEVVSAFFAQSAHLESAAVVAFEYLAQELEAYHAPTEFIQLANEAAQEEIEHAKLMTELAAHFGSATVPKVEVTPFALRPLHEIAYENALEGCTRETYGALKGLWQAETAEESFVRTATAQVGHDESRHAALSWAIDDWIRPLLTAEQNATCDRIQKESMEALRQEVTQPIHPALIRWAGYPPPHAAKLLLQESFSA